MPMPSSLRAFFARFALAAGLSLVFCSRMIATAAEASLVPPFGTDGKEFTNKAQNQHVVHGWLPNDWEDNTEWAPISATYSKLDDTPDQSVTAVRINLEKMDDGQLQF